MRLLRLAGEGTRIILTRGVYKLSGDCNSLADVTQCFARAEPALPANDDTTEDAEKQRQVWEELQASFIQNHTSQDLILCS